MADDEELARQRLRRLLEENPDVEVVGEAASGAEAIELADKARPHLVFLDIRMPPPTGLEAARILLDRESPPMVVFLTAYEEHAVEAFELRAFDYLVKPVEKERLDKTLQKMRESLEDEDRWQRRVAEVVKSVFRPPQEPALDRLAVKDNVTEVREVVSVNEIDFFTARDEKTFAHLRGKDFQVSVNLTRLEATLPDDFFRSHRGYIVNTKRIAQVVPWFNGAYTLVMRDKQEVPLSRGQVASFREKVPWL